MNATVKIRPSVTQIVTANGRSAISEIHLGGAPRGAVVILDGPEHRRFDVVEVMGALAEHGYESVCAPTNGLLGDRGEENPTAVLVEDLAAHLGQRDWSREQIGVLGFGCGGVAALEAAGTEDYGAAVSVCPTLLASVSTPRLSHVRTPWLGIFGDLGPVRDAMADATERQRRNSSAFAQVVEFRGCGEDFSWAPEDSAAYAASFDAWQRIVEWLNLRVVPRPTARTAMWRRRESPAHPYEPMREEPMRCPDM
ncbi:MAG: dienelactone hydrolase family protein [Aeromicrobium sp.]